MAHRPTTRGDRVKFFFLVYTHEPDAHPDVGGFRKPWELAAQLQRLGHAVTIFCPRRYGPQDEPSIPCVRFPVIPLPLLRPLWAYGMLFLLPLIRGMRERPGWVYFRKGAACLPVLLARWLGARVLLEFNGDVIGEVLARGGRVGLRLRLLQWFEGFNARHADRVVALTDGLKGVLVDRYRVASTRIMVIPSGSNIEHFRPMDPAACRARFGLSMDHRVVSFLGVLYEHQGIQILARAAAQVIAQHPGTHFLIGGDGPYRPAIEQAVQRAGLDDRFRLLGRVPYGEAPLVIGASDVCVAPFLKSRGETSPLKVLDYLACGRPVVVSDIPSIRSLISEGDAVMSVPPDDPDQLASALLRILGDRARWAQRGSAGRRLIEARYSWAVIAGQVSRLCEDGT